MNEEQPRLETQGQQGKSIEVPKESSQKAKSKTTNILLVALIFMLAVAAAVGGYYLGDKAADNNADTTTLTEETNTKVAADSPVSSFHLVKTVGYPLGSGKKVEVTLGVASDYQVIADSPTIQDPGLTQYFTDGIFNNSLARWKFGFPAVASTEKVGEIGLVAISGEWLSGSADAVADDDSSGFYTELSTSAKRNQYVKQQQIDTTNCVKSSTKGYVLGGLINVCYDITTPTQSTGSYSPTLNFVGYGEKDGIAMVLEGYIKLYDGKTYTAAEQDAFQTAAGTASYALEVQDAVVAALKESTVTISSRS